MPKEEKVLHLTDDDEPNMEKEEEEDEHELRCGTCDNKMILCITKGQQSAFSNSGCVEKPLTEGLANIVMVEAIYKSEIKDKYKLYVKGWRNHTQLRRTQ